MLNKEQEIEINEVLSKTINKLKEELEKEPISEERIAVLTNTIKALTRN